MRIVLNVHEVAERLGLSEGFVYRELSAGHMPGALQIGRRWRIPLPVVIAYEAAHRHEADDDERDDGGGETGA